MKYYDKLIFEISRPGRVGYSLPKNWTTDKLDGEFSIFNSQFSILLRLCAHAHQHTEHCEGKHE